MIVRRRSFPTKVVSCDDLGWGESALTDSVEHIDRTGSTRCRTGAPGSWSHKRRVPEWTRRSAVRTRQSSWKAATSPSTSVVRVAAATIASANQVTHGSIRSWRNKVSPDWQPPMSRAICTETGGGIVTFRRRVRIHPMRTRPSRPFPSAKGWIVSNWACATPRITKGSSRIVSKTSAGPHATPNGRPADSMAPRPKPRYE